MAQDFAKAFYKSKAWRDCRASFIKSVFGLCRRCQQPGYIVHHKELLTPDNINDQEVTLNWSKLEYLCKDCHELAHSESDPVRHDVRFDEKGQLVER